MAKKQLTDKQKTQRVASNFKRKITTTFKNAGFEYLNTEGIHRRFGLKIGELDYVFLYENIIIICEDTTTSSEEGIKKHLKNKKILTEQIVANKSNTITWLKETYPEKFESFGDYSDDSYRLFHLYFPMNKANLTKEDKELYDPIIIIEYPQLNYLSVTAQAIKRSAKSEIFRLLRLTSEDIGTPGGCGASKSIPAPIIYPTDRTGLKTGIRIVSFMMSAEMLLKNSYVLRKDNWEGTIKLYQRLLDRSKLLKTRKYIADNKATFFNNIIVSLPREVTFELSDKAKTPIALKDIHKYENCKMIIPDEMNSICVIDGQHRIFAHYEGNDDLEPVIATLREKLHLLVTGLIFPPGMSDLERRKYESSIFEDINSNAKPVQADVLLQIRALREPFSDLAIARSVVVLLNDRGVFRDRFQLSQMDKQKIKIASIIKYALRYLVDITEDVNRPTLFQHWGGDRALLLKKDNEEALEEYTTYIVNTLDQYFSLVRNEYLTEWNDPDSKILSITSLNGLLIALRKSLNTCGVGNGPYYESVLHNYHFNFSKTGFGYGSSQYNMFAEEILKKNYQLIKDIEGNWIKP